MRNQNACFSKICQRLKTACSWSVGMYCVFLEGITGLRLCNCWDGKYADTCRAVFIPLKHGKRSVLSVDVERWAQPSLLRCLSLFFVPFHVALLSVWNAHHTSRLWPDFYRLQFLWKQRDLNPQMNSNAQFTKKKTKKKTPENCIHTTHKHTTI